MGDALTRSVSVLRSEIRLRGSYLWYGLTAHSSCGSSSPCEHTPPSPITTELIQTKGCTSLPSTWTPTVYPCMQLQHIPHKVSICMYTAAFQSPAPHPTGSSCSSSLPSSSKPVPLQNHALHHTIVTALAHHCTWH